MSPARRRLSKLTRPRLHAPVVRERLFRRLDDLRATAPVWIAGPPGAGKTALVSSYLEAARAGVLWYQVDPADSDPATFFYFLRELVLVNTPRRGRALPLFTPEYLPDLRGFARRFFREACLRMPAGTVLVLDNLQELAADSPVHSALVAFVEELPEHAGILAISRTDPPPAFAECILNSRLSILSWNELRLSAEEGEAVAVAAGLQNIALARRFHEQTDGWFAGFSLLLERARAGTPSRVAVRADAMETVFDYFSQVIFERVPATVQHVLLVAALLPVAEAALVSRLAETSEALNVLESLYRRHLFLERTSSDTPTYRLHALFRAFLRHRSLSVMTPAERQAIARHAAAAFEEAGRMEDAFTTWVDAEDLTQAVRLMATAAPGLLAQGRWRTVLEWTDIASERGAVLEPWPLYWRGRAMVFSNRGAARELLDMAYRAFHDAADLAGQIICAAGVLEVLYLSYRDFLAMDPWIEVIAALLDASGLVLAPADELRVNASLLMAASYRNPDHPALPRALERVRHLLPKERDPNLAVSVASVLHGYENTSLDISAADLAMQIARPLLGNPELLAINAGLYLAMEGYTHYMHGRYGQSLTGLDDAENLIAGLGFAELEMNVSTWRALCLRRDGRLDEAEATIRKMDSASGAIDTCFAPRFFIKSCVAFDRGRHLEAVDLARRGWAVAESGGQYVGIMLVGTVTSNILVGSGACELAEEFLARMRAHVSGPVTRHYLCAIEMNEAWLEHRRGREESRDGHLRQALRRASDPRARERLRWYGNALSELLPVALERGIEADTAREIALAFDVRPGRLWLESWPWRLRVYVMGRFEVWVDGRPVEFGRKAPRKTLALLKAVIAFGSRDVPEDRLADALWPGEEADAARQSLGAALHRLRRWLGNADAIRQSGGTLSVDLQICWIDAVALEGTVCPERSADETDRLFLRHYRGPLLAGDQGEPWTLPLRERLRGRFIRVVERVAGLREREQDFEGAAALYERGLDADMLVESFHQGLMRCHLALCRHAEAASAYRRLQRTLSQTLGVAPSDESLRLLGLAIRTE